MAAHRCVVVGDVVASRAETDRESLRRRLDEGMAEANEAVAGDVVAPFTTLKGVDEIGGVLATPARAYPALRAIAEAVHPTAIRFAVVWGELDVGLDETDVSKMDGPAFHEADALLTDLADSGRTVALSVGADEWLERLVADQIDLLFMWKDEWTVTQADVVRQYREAGSMKAVAEQRDVSVQAVSQTLARADAARVLEIEAGLETAMAELWGEQV